MKTTLKYWKKRMSLMNNPWEQINLPSRDIYSRRVSSEHPLNLFWAKDPLGHFLFVYEFSTPDHLPKKFPVLNGIKVHLLKPEDNNAGEYMLILLLKEKNDWQIFLSLCNDIISATSEFEQPSHATKVILRRLKRWQEFLQLPRSDLLPEKTIKGLIGELLFLSLHLQPAFGIEQSIQYWQGPDDLPQDFSVESCAIEVKTQLGSTTPRVRISSADQLCTQLPQMYLHVITLGKTDSETEEAINLPGLVAEIRRMLEEESPSSFERFSNLLFQTGYVDSDDYLQFSYILTSEQTYLIEKGFPRICPDTLTQGIDNVRYDINLLDCEPYIGLPDWMDSHDV